MSEPTPFAETSRGKLRCGVCGRSGWPGSGPRHWSTGCIAGHPFGCSCSRVFPSLASRSAHLRRSPACTAATDSAR